MKKLSLVSTTTLVALGLVAVAQPVSAATASSATNNADIQFQQKGPDTPNNNALIEPENENREETIYLPSTSNEDKRKDNRGPLVIDYVSDFHFNIEKMSGNNVTYYAKTATVFETQADADANTNPVTVPNYVQVTDDRGTNAGWTLKVKQTKDFATSTAVAGANDGSTLKGTTLKIKNINAFKRASNLGELPTTFATGNQVALSTGDADQIFASAKENEGTGSIALLAGNVKTATPTADKSISLDVPGNIKKQKDVQYKAELTWTLEDVPSN